MIVSRYYLRLYLDFQKAFDKVPHQRLLLNLRAHGIGDGIIDWIEQWLTDRRQRVLVDGEVSNWKSVLSGAPQGSVLGSLLFLIYINDLDNNITSNVLKFVGDTKVFRKVNKIYHPSQRPRWQVDKEAIGLSRVQQCSSTYNPPS